MGDDFLHALERENRKRHERARAVIAETGGDEALSEFDRSMKDVRTGVTHAKNIWHSISKAQRRVLQVLSAGHQPQTAHAVRSVHALEGRGLVTTAGAHTALTEHGAFVLTHGPPSP